MEYEEGARAVVKDDRVYNVYEGTGSALIPVIEKMIASGVKPAEIVEIAKVLTDHDLKMVQARNQHAQALVMAFGGSVQSGLDTWVTIEKMKISAQAPAEELVVKIDVLTRILNQMVEARTPDTKTNGKGHGRGAQAK